MSAIKEFYGGTFLNKENLESGVSKEKIELKYYKIINNVSTKSRDKAKFGIEVVKTELV